MKISTVGFSDFDRQLLSRQLKIVTGHTAIDWEYVGERVHDADVLLVRSTQDALAASVQSLLERFDGVVAVAGETGAGLAHALRLEWPVRVFSLLSVLDQAEAQLDTRAPLRPVCEQLADLCDDVWLEVHGWPVLIRGRDGLILGMGGCFEQLLEAFMLDGSRLLASLQHDAAPERPVVWRASVSRLVWSMALYEGEQATSNWPDAGRSYQISSYPHFEEWEVTPQFLRLAALFTRGHATLADAVTRISVDEARIRAFLYACQQCRLGLETKEIQQTAQPQQVAATGLLGMLGQLRSRLGLAFR